MSDSHHDLASEFPEMKEAIHTLKTTNDHFKRLLEKYHDLNKQISRSEQRIDTIGELDEEKLRKERLTIKDQLYTMLTRTNS